MEFEDFNPPLLIFGSIFIFIGIIDWKFITAKFFVGGGLFMIIAPIIIALIRERKSSNIPKESLK